ncbi:hypothetical protein IQ06DRAFT_130804 [Phaeosphaeriaceae sp. SRC1lsM3a]|nr:hypothetical protein IQ06DRAFT_130804 [Stagonospora sp. SRC1lsM3a]
MTRLHVGVAMVDLERFIWTFCRTVRVKESLQKLCPRFMTIYIPGHFIASDPFACFTIVVLSILKLRSVVPGLTCHFQTMPTVEPAYFTRNYLRTEMKSHIAALINCDTVIGSHSRKAISCRAFCSIYSMTRMYVWSSASRLLGVDLVLQVRYATIRTFVPSGWKRCITPPH